MGATHIVECGPGKVLAGMTKRIDAEVQSLTLADARRSSRRCKGCIEPKARSRWSPALARHRHAIARELVKQGAKVVGTATTRGGAQKVPGIGRCSNVRDVRRCDALIDRCKDVGDIAILVNNAGITRDNLALRMKDAGLGRGDRDQSARRVPALRA
jgi:hypothetical protein